jgi:hypothetical protein
MPSLCDARSRISNAKACLNPTRCVSNAVCNAVSSSDLAMFVCVVPEVIVFDVELLYVAVVVKVVLKECISNREGYTMSIR